MLSVSNMLVSFYQTGCLRRMKFQRSEMIRKSGFPYLFIDHNAFHEIFFMEGASKSLWSKILLDKRKQGLEVRLLLC